MNTAVRNKDLRFFRQGDSWYADVPNHTLKENRMVAGADSLLASMADGADEVCVTLSADVDDPGEYLIKLKRIEHDPWGATYLANIDGLKLLRPAWLCNVTHDVFGGELPKKIYIHSVRT